MFSGDVEKNINLKQKKSKQAGDLNLNIKIISP